MIFDAFLFFNETELLELRLQELSGVVDRFVLVESTVTFAGTPKPLYYAQEKERFAAYHPRITHVVVDDTPHTDDPWIRQTYQRNAILRGLASCSPSDLVLISDLDEIPRPEVLAEVRSGLNAFAQRMYYYYLNVACTSAPTWHGTVALRRSELGMPQDARDQRNLAPTVLADGGWHFSYLGGPAAILEKLRSLSAQEYNTPLYTDIDYIRTCLADGRDFLGRDLQWRTVAIDESYPKSLLKDLEKYRGFLLDASTLAGLTDITETVPKARYFGIIGEAQRQMDKTLRRVRSLEQMLADRELDLADARSALLSGRAAANVPSSASGPTRQADQPGAGTALYDRAFYENRHRTTLHSARRVLGTVRDILPRLESAVDLGCGIGTWLAVLGEMGVTYLRGLDGEWVPSDQLKIRPDQFLRHDLRTVPDLPERFDLALSLEVAEHLPPSAAEPFVTILTTLSDFVLFSAAVPGQGGTGHINEQWPEYWIELFERRGFVCVDAIRRRVALDQDVLSWYRRNTLLFVRAERTSELRTLGPMTDYLPTERCGHADATVKLPPGSGIPLELGAGIRLEVQDAPEQTTPGSEFQVRVNVVAPPGVRLSSRLEHPIHLSYHWQDAKSGQRVVHDGRRTVLEPPIEGGSARLVAAKVSAPDTPGTFVLQMRLVQEGTRWFEEVQADDCAVRVVDSAAIDPEARPSFSQFGVHTIFVEISTVCNMRCAFCPIDHIDRPRRRMDYATFTRVADEIAALAPPEAISLNVLGEPLLHPDVFRFIDYCATKGIRVYLFTNGTLDEDDLRQICERDNIEALVLSYQTPDEESFTLRRAGLSFEQYKARVLGAVEYVFRASAYRKMRVEIHLANTKHLPFRDWDVLTSNEQAIQTIRSLADEILNRYVAHLGLEAEAVSVADDPQTIPANILDLREWDYWGYRAAPNTFIRVKYMGTFGAVATALPPGVEVRERTTPVHCDMLKEALCVLADGRITNCCLDVNGEMVFGDVTTGTILDALRSDARQRSIQDPTTNATCRRCAGDIVVTPISGKGMNDDRRGHETRG